MTDTSSGTNLSYEGAALQKRAAFFIEQLRAYAAASGNAEPSVLDFGSGLGNIPTLLGAQGYRVTGTDLDPESIAACTARNTLPNVRFAVGNAETMELDEQFDAVIASEIIEHVFHPEKVIRTMRRHLRNGGIGIISIPNGYCLWEMVVSRFLQRRHLVDWFYRLPRVYKLLTGGETPFYSKNAFCYHEQFFTFGRFKRLLEAEGFRIRLARNSDLGLLPEWRALRFLKKLECRMADVVPHFLSGGWLLVIRRDDDDD